MSPADLQLGGFLEASRDSVYLATLNRFLFLEFP